MGLNLAPTTWAFFLFVLAELVFILIPMIVFKLQKKSLKYEFAHRVIPQPRNWKKRSLDIILGLIIGIAFVYIGAYIRYFLYWVTVSVFGPDFFETAQEGSVDTSPPALTVFELILTIILNFMTVGLAEEFCFRGVLLKEFGKKSKIWGVLISSAFFMIYHVFPGVVPLATFVTFWLYYFTFGVILAVITILNKGDLIMAIIAHGAFNSIIFILSYSDWLG